MTAQTLSQAGSNNVLTFSSNGMGVQMRRTITGGGFTVTVNGMDWGYWVGADMEKVRRRVIATIRP